MARKDRRQNITVSAATFRTLSALASETGEPIDAVLGRAIEQYRRARVFARAAEEWNAIQADPAAKAVLDREYALWDGVAGDGLDAETW